MKHTCNCKIYLNAIQYFFTDWPTQDTTPTVALLTTSSSPAESPQPTWEHLTTASSTTAKPADSCFQNITVAYPVRSFCTHRVDGLYVRSDNPKTFYRCVQRETYVTKCHTLGTEHSYAVTVAPSDDVVIISFVMTALIHVLSVWSFR